MNPGDIELVLEFVQKFHKQCIILNLDVNNPKSSMLPGLANHIPGCKRVAFVTLLCFLDPQASSSDFVKHFNKLRWKVESAHRINEE